jgi:hypothetical protein
MAKLIYAPKDGERKEWEFDVNALTIGECKLLEKVQGQTTQQFGEDLANGSMTAMAALLWILRKRHEPDLMLNDLDDIQVGALLTVEDDEAPKDETPDESPTEE